MNGSGNHPCGSAMAFLTTAKRADQTEIEIIGNLAATLTAHTAVQPTFTNLCQDVQVRNAWNEGRCRPRDRDWCRPLVAHTIGQSSNEHRRS